MTSEDVLGGFHIGDFLVQLFLFAFVLLIIVLVISIFRSSRKRKNKLNRLEEKIDEIQSKLDK